MAVHLDDLPVVPPGRGELLELGQAVVAVVVVALKIATAVAVVAAHATRGGPP